MTDEFWRARPELGYVRHWAKARMASPYAVLGVLLARVITATPPTVMLPAIIGDVASLNLFVAVVARSGGGKGAASAVAKLVHRIDVEEVGAGSGEGLAHLFGRREKDYVVLHNTAALMDVAEIDTLASIRARQGSTVMPELRKAWMGERLGFSWADEKKRVPVEAHAYRFCLVAGVQPARSGGLLGDADGGTPQRFLWMPGSDPRVMRQPPKDPRPQDWKVPLTALNSSEQYPLVMGVCGKARETVVDAHYRRMREEADALDGHSLLTQLKAAAGLALLGGGVEIEEEDWDLAGDLMDVSDTVRQACAEELAEKAREASRQLGSLDIERAIARDSSKAAVARVARSLVQKLSDHGGWVTGAELRRKVPYRDREHFEAAVRAAVGQSFIAQRDGRGGGKVYRISAGKG